MSKDIVDCIHWDPEVDPVAQQARQNSRWILLAGALVVAAVAVGVSLLLFLPKREPLPGEPTTTEAGQATSVEGWTDPGPQTQPQTPPDDNLSLTRGIELYNSGNYALALISLEQAVAADPESGAAYTYRGLTQFSLGKYQEAVQDFTQAMRRMDPTAELTLMRGTSHYMLQLYPEAISDLTKAIELNPGSANAFTYRALAYEATGRPDLAAADRARIGQ